MLTIAGGNQRCNRGIGDVNSEDESAAIASLLREAGELEHGKTRLAMVEEAVRLADLHGDDQLRADARFALVDAATYSGRTPLAFVAFAWLLAQFDRQPELVSESKLLWRYKWIVGAAPDYPCINRAQIENMLINEKYATHEESYLKDARKSVYVEYRNASYSQ